MTPGFDPADQGVSDSTPRWLPTALAVGGLAVCLLAFAVALAAVIVRGRKGETKVDTTGPAEALTRAGPSSSEPPSATLASRTDPAPIADANDPGSETQGGDAPDDPADMAVGSEQVSNDSGDLPSRLETTPARAGSGRPPLSKTPSRTIPGTIVATSQTELAVHGSTPASASHGSGPSAAEGGGAGSTAGTSDAAGAPSMDLDNAADAPATPSTAAGDSDGAADQPPAGAEPPAATEPKPAGDGTRLTGTLRIPPRQRAMDKQPVPPDDARSRAVRQVKEEAPDAYDPTTNRSQRRALGLELFRRAFGERDAALRYVLLDEFCTIATTVGDSKLALSAVQELESSYQIDGWARRAAVLEQLLEQADSEPERRALVGIAIGMLVDAMDAHQLNTARDLAQLASTQAKKIKDSGVQRALLIQTKQLDTRWSAVREAEDLQARHARAPNDTTVNFQLGRCLGLSENDWRTSLQYLSRGNDRALATLAAADLAGAPDDAQCIQVANQWYDQAHVRKNNVKTRDLCLARARALYRQLQSRLLGPLRTAVDERLQELTAGLPTGLGVGAARPPLLTLPWLDGPAGELRTFDGHQQNITALAVAPDGMRFVSASEDLSVRSWDLQTGDRRWTANVRTANAHGLAYSSDGLFIVGNYDNNKLIVWHADRGAASGEIPTSSRSPTDIVVLPDSRRVIWGCRAQPPNIAVWDVRERRPWGQFGDGDTPTVLDVTADGRMLVTADAHGMVRVWHVESGLLLKEFRSHDDAVTSLNLSPDGGLVATATFGQIRVTEIDSGRILGTLTSPHIRTVAFSPDGRRLVTGGAREEVFVWDLASGRRLASLKAEAAFSEGQILRLAFLPDPRGLVTGATGGKLRLWKLPD